MVRWLRRLMLWFLLPPLILLLISFSAVLLTPTPADPWRSATIPANGLYIQVSDGAELFLREWAPSPGAVKQVVLGLHGIGQHSGYQERAGVALQQAGIAYYALDLRGNGLTRTPHGDIPSQTRLYDDITEVIEQLRARFPESRLYVLGHSLGGALAASWAAETAPKIDGLLLLAPAMTATAAPVPWTNWVKGPASWLVLHHRAVLQIGDSAYDPERLRQIVDNPEDLAFIANDPLQLRSMSMAFALSANDLRQHSIERAPKIAVPTLLLVGDQDEAATGARQLYDALTISDKRWITLPWAKHMLFQIKETGAVMQEVAAWLAQH